MIKRLFLAVAVTGLLSSCNFENFNERCIRECKEFTEQQCPRRLDPCTVMDSMTYDASSQTLTYHYTVEGILDSAEVYTPEIVADFTEKLRQDVTNSVQLKRYKEEGINFNYRYISKSKGDVVLNITFKETDYASSTR